MLKKNILSLQPKSTRLPCKGMLIFFKNDTYRGVEQLVARQAHNLEVACSSLASATSPHPESANVSLSGDSVKKQGTN